MFLKRLALAMGLFLVAGCSGGITPRINDAAQMERMPPALSPADIRPAPMAKTAIQDPSVMSVKPAMALTFGTWTQIPGVGSFAAAAPDGSLWVLSDQPSGSDKYIWHYVNGSWSNISGLASRITVAPDGTLYAINSGGGAYRYSNGSFVPLGGGCSDLTAASDGSIYVLSNGNTAGSDQAIWQYTTTWGQVPGTGVRIAASWDSHGYTIPAGSLSAAGLYVTNSSGAIWYKNTDNTYILLPGSASSAVATTVGGFLVLAYPSSGSGNAIYYYNFDTPGWSAETGSAVSIATDSTHIYAVSTSGGIFSSALTAGPILTQFNIGYYTLGITAGPDGNLWAAGWQNNVIVRMTTSGTTAVFSNGISSGARPRGITAGADGNLWFTESGSFAPGIGRITTSGTVTEFPLASGASPDGITSGPDGNLWFAEAGGNKIGRITPSGTLTEFSSGISSGSSLTGITRGPDGNLWFTENAGNRIGRITTSGTVTEFSAGISSGAGPAYITTGPDGNLWFTENSGNRIGRITPSGTVTEFSTGITSNSGPYGITSGADGALWFGENLGRRIGRITTGGIVTEYSGLSAGSYQITTGPDNKVWFTEPDATSVGRLER